MRAKDENESTMALDDEKDESTMALDDNHSSDDNLTEVLFDDSDDDDYVPSEETTYLDDVPDADDDVITNDMLPEEDGDDPTVASQPALTSEKQEQLPPAEPDEEYVDINGNRITRHSQFKTQSGQGMFSNEERQAFEEEHLREKEKSKVNTIDSQTQVASVLAQKLHLGDEANKIPIYDDSATAALYYNGKENNTQAEEAFMNGIENQSFYSDGTSPSVTDSPTPHIEPTESVIANQQAHKAKKSYFGNNDQAKKSTDKGKSSQFLKIVIVVAIVVALLALFL